MEKTRNQLSVMSFLFLACVVWMWSACQPGKGQTGSEPTETEQVTTKDAGTTPLPNPEITISSPVRAAMLTGSPAIKVEGTLNLTGNQIKRLSVNGESVTPGEDGSFQHTIVATWGLNVLTVEVLSEDGIPAKRVQSFLWAKTYQALDGKRIEKAAMARINRDGIDDSNRSTLNDLASILEIVINTIEIDPLVPEVLVEDKYKIPPIGPTVTYTVKKTGKVEVGKRTLKVTPRKNGLVLWARLEDLKIPVKGSAGKYLNKSATVAAPSVEIEADADLRIENGEIVFAIKEVKIDVSKLEVTAFTGIFKFLNGMVTNKVRDILKTKLETILKDLLPLPVKGYLASFSFAKSFVLPDALGGKEISLDSGIDTLVFDKEGGVIGLSVALSSKVGVPDAKLGVPLHSQKDPTWSTSKYVFGVGLSYNLINQALVAAWQSGALKQDLTSLLVKPDQPLPMNAKSMKLQVEASLPPILSPGSNPREVRVAAGDVFLNVQLVQQNDEVIEAQLYLSAVIGAVIQLSPQNEISLKLNASPENVAFDLLKVKGVGDDDIPANMFQDMLEPMIPGLLDVLTSSLLQKIPIPSFDLSTFAGKYGIPPGTVLSLKNGSVSLDSDFVKITGSL
jgi:uncharacterized protein YfaP (DUF2135 family)